MAQAIMLPSSDMLDTYHHNSLLTRPEARRLTQLEQEMANVLARTDISDKQKMDLFALTLENFRRVRGEIINNGLMLTSTNAPQPPLKESEAEELFGKIQDLIQKLNNPQQSKTSANSSTATPAPAPAPAPTPQPNPSITATPKKYTPFLTKDGVNLKKELIRNAIIQPADGNTDKFHVDGTNYTRHQVHRALAKLTSNDDVDSSPPIIKLLAHRIYKNMLKNNADINKFTKFKFFNTIAHTSNITPRPKKTKNIQQPKQQPTTPATIIRPIATAKKRSMTSSTSSIKKPKIGNGPSVDFILWDKH